jgi:methionine synthase II (cobalamin-independent)
VAGELSSLNRNNGQEVETADYLKRRLDEATRIRLLEGVALCPRCGLRSLDEDVQWAKLGVIQQVAADVWGTS